MLNDKLSEIQKYIDEAEDIHEYSAFRLKEILQIYVKEVKERRLKNIPIERLKDFGIKRLPWSLLKSYEIDNLKALKDTDLTIFLQSPGVGKTTVERLKKATEELIKQIENEPIPLPSPDLTSPIEMKVAEAALLLLHTRAFYNQIASEIVPKYKLLQEKLQEFKSRATFFNWLIKRASFLNWKEEKEKYEIIIKEVSFLVPLEIIKEKEHLSEIIEEGLPEKTILEDFRNRYVECISLIEKFLFEIHKKGAQKVQDDSTGRLPLDIVDRVKDVPLNLKKMKAVLRNYQEFGIKYILSQKRVIVGDEMGLGKTIEALGSACHLSAERSYPIRSLVVCPASLIFNWIFEVRDKTELPHFLLYGTPKKRQREFEKWREMGGIGITSYNTVSSFPLLKTDAAPHFLIVDEAHFVKNPKTKRTTWIKEIASNAEYVCLMTGTPLENHPREFVNLIRIVNPELANKLSLRKVDVVSPDIFKERVASVYIRRNQKDVLRELPKKIEVLTRLKMNNKDEIEYRKAVIEKNFHQMRLVSVIGADGNSAKITRLRELIDEYSSEGKKIVIFSFYLKVLETIQNVVDVVGVLKGDIAAAKRAEIVQKFQKFKGHAVLACQINVGGHGLNLQAASVVVLMEPQLKPTLEDQAVARVVRMGQTNVVTVHKLITENSVEEKIIEILQKKKEFFNEYALESVVASVAQKEDSEKNLVKMIIDSEYRRIVGKENI